MQEALALKHLVDFVSSNRHFCVVLIMGLALKISIHMLALLGGAWTVRRDTIDGIRDISLNFLMLLFFLR